MKIVDFETFTKLPPGTIFAPYKPCCLQDCLAIKVDKGQPWKVIGGKVGYYFNGVMPLEPGLMMMTFYMRSVTKSLRLSRHTMGVLSTIRNITCS